MSFFKFLFKYKTSVFQILFGFIFLCFLLVFIPIFLNYNSWDDTWLIVEPLLGAVTLFFATFIWLNEKIEDWNNLLPKRLEVEYVFEDKIYVKVLNAPLTSEDDIRAWGQSIAQTLLNDTYKINFSGFLIDPEVKPGKLSDGTKVNIYKVSFFLTKKVDKLPDDYYELIFDDNGKLKK